MAEYICPHCKKPVYDDDAILCLYCGESLNRPGKYRIPKFLVVLIIVLVLLSFLLLTLR